VPRHRPLVIRFRRDDYGLGRDFPIFSFLLPQASLLCTRYVFRACPCFFPHARPDPPPPSNFYQGEAAPSQHRSPCEATHSISATFQFHPHCLVGPPPVPLLLRRAINVAVPPHSFQAAFSPALEAAFFHLHLFGPIRTWLFFYPVLFLRSRIRTSLRRSKAGKTSPKAPPAVSLRRFLLLAGTVLCHGNCGLKFPFCQVRFPGGVRTTLSHLRFRTWRLLPVVRCQNGFDRLPPNGMYS